MTGELRRGDDAGRSTGGKPDPTILTTQAVRREITLLRELFDARFESLIAIQTEKFGAIAERFGLVEQQRLEQKADTKAAVDAALTAQKEAVKEQTTASELAISKSENATVKQLEQLGTTFKTTIEGVTTIVGDLKERVGRFESLKVGGKEAVNGLWVALGGLVGAAGIVVAIIALVSR